MSPPHPLSAEILRGAYERMIRHLHALELEWNALHDLNESKSVVHLLYDNLFVALFKVRPEAVARRKCWEHQNHEPQLFEPVIRLMEAVQIDAAVLPSLLESPAEAEHNGVLESVKWLLEELNDGGIPLFTPESAYAYVHSASPNVITEGAETTQTDGQLEAPRREPASSVTRPLAEPKMKTTLTTAGETIRRPRSKRVMFSDRVRGSRK
jgi:hypothetical protein